MDLDELIRTELTAQADRAPDAETVLAGVPGRARARARRRRRIAAAATAAVAVLAAAVPYAVLRADPPAAPEPPAATATPTARPESFPLRIEPGWLPPGWKEWARRASPGYMRRDYANAVNGDSSRTYLQLSRQLVEGGRSTKAERLTIGGKEAFWYSDQPMGGNRSTKAERLTIGGKEAFWYSDQPTFRRLGYGQAELIVRWSATEWMTVGVQWRNPTERKALAVRIAESVRPSRDTLTSTVLVGGLPAGTDRGNAEVSADRYQPGGWSVRTILWTTDPGPVIVTRQELRPGAPGVGSDRGSRPVTVNGRRAYFTEGSTSRSPSYVGMALPDGTTLRVIATATEAEIIRIAGNIVPLPVDLDRLGG